MLMQLGVLTFEVYPFNADQVMRDTGADFAAKDVMSTRRSREFMGEADENIQITGRLFPERFGGLDGLETLDAMRASGIAQLLVRGDGKNMGWFLIERVNERSGFLDREGVGRLIDFSINIVKAKAPSASALEALLVRLLA